jgi:hypothetical protein
MAKFSLDDFPVVKAQTLATPNSITVYGPPGKGKSVFASSIVEVPGFERTLVIDTEGSSVAIGPHYPGVDIVHARTADAFTKLSEAILSGDFVEQTSGLPYQAVVIDTFDKAQSRQLDVFAKSPQARNSNGQENTFYKWGAIKMWSEKVSDLFHQADILAIFVLHSTETDPEKGPVKTTVMLQGSSQDFFPSVSDAVAYFDIIKPKDGPNKGQEIRTADFRPSARLVSKQRFAGKLNLALTGENGAEGPTMTQVFKLIDPARFD